MITAIQWSQMRVRWILQHACWRALDDENQWWWAKSNIYYGA